MGNSCILEYTNIYNMNLRNDSNDFHEILYAWGFTDDESI